MSARGWGRLLVALGGILFGAPGLDAQLSTRPNGDEVLPPRITAAPVGDGAGIQVDGVLREPAWAAARPLTQLWQLEPDEGAPASYATEVRVAFDTERLYIGVRAATGPSRIIARIRERDQLMVIGPSGDLGFNGDDGIAFLLDAVHDRRSAVVLATNPLGARFDAQVSNDGGDVNIEWDGVWDVEVARVDGGWSAELAIPFSVLRSDASTWGFNVYRVLRQENEHALWTSWRRGSEGFLRVSRAGELAGLRRVDSGELRGLQAKPYALIRDRTPGATGGLSGTTDMGIDFKAELGPGLVLDATLNPDFATADVDDEEVNLTRYDLFLPEKRGFFLENSGVFGFGVRSGGEAPPFEMFHSRRLGIGEFGPVRVLGGGRLTGRVGAQAVGLLHVATDRSAPVPYTSGTVARVKRDAGEAGYVGAMITHASGQAGRSTTGGFDASLWPTSELNVQAFYVRSGSTGRRGDAAYSTSVHYDSEWLGFDGEYTVVGPDARADLGFMARADVRRAKGLLRVTVRPPLPGIRRVDINILGNRFATSEGTLTDRALGPAIAVHTDAGDWLNVYTTYGRTHLQDSFDLVGRISVPVGRYADRLRGVGVRSSAARPLGASVQASEERAFDGRISSVALSAWATVLGRLTVEPGIALSSAELPGGSFEARVPRLGLRYALSHRLVASFRAQRNTLDGDRLTRLRMEYLYRPGSEIFLVLQSSRSLVDGLVQRRRSGIVKVTWLHQF